MSARLVQHLSCLLILSQKVKELRPNLEVASAKLLQKSEMRKDIVIELSYKGFS